MLMVVKSLLTLAVRLLLRQQLIKLDRITKHNIPRARTKVIIRLVWFYLWPGPVSISFFLIFGWNYYFKCEKHNEWPFHLFLSIFQLWENKYLNLPTTSIFPSGSDFEKKLHQIRWFFFKAQWITLLPVATIFLDSEAKTSKIQCFWEDRS